MSTQKPAPVIKKPANEPTSPINPKGHGGAENQFVNEGNPAAPMPKTESVSTKTVLEHLSNPKK